MKDTKLEISFANFLGVLLLMARRKQYDHTINKYGGYIISKKGITGGHLYESKDNVRISNKEVESLQFLKKKEIEVSSSNF